MSLDALRERLEKTKQLAGWIASATEKAAEFSSDVVQKVIADYSAQYDSELPGLLELAEAASTERQSLADQADELEATKAEVESSIDEFRLRHVIGELTEEEFVTKEQEARESIDEEALEGARAEMAIIDELLSAVGEVQSQVAAVLGKPVPVADPTPEPEPEASPAAVAAEVEMDVAGEVASPDDDALGEEAYAAGGEQEDQEWEVEPASEDVSMGPGSAASEEGNVESLDVQSAGDDEAIGATPDLSSSEAALDLGAGSSEELEPVVDSGAGPRLLVTMPGSPGPETYPFTGDVMSLGRGRNNDIQIKNDGKISRYHCRIFRHEGEFIVEDNKSSNGTLVDGKLITRQPLLGGELVQLGETRVEFMLS